MINATNMMIWLLKVVIFRFATSKNQTVRLPPSMETCQFFLFLHCAEMILRCILLHLVASTALQLGSKLFDQLCRQKISDISPMITYGCNMFERQYRIRAIPRLLGN